MAQNEKPDIAFCGGEVGQVGSLRGQRFAITIESGSLKPGAITDESNGARLSSGCQPALGDPRSRFFSVCKRTSPRPDSSSQ